MREIAFIRQNKEKWLEIEQVINGELRKDPDELSSLYINLINDLSYAQTYFTKSKTTTYLNFLSAQIFQKIYKTKRIEENRFKVFFFREVPLIVFEHRKTLLFSFAVFAVFVLVGIISSYYDSNFARLILGDNYVETTLANIAKGNATAIYESGSNWGSAIGIIANNLRVGAILFLYGIFLGIGTFISLMQNSLMLGTFQQFFATHHVLGESMRGIWLHGAFEISTMIIEAMAGFMLGSAILFPKTFSRMSSFKIGFKNAFKVYISTIPFVIFAGIIEGFVTRYAQTMSLFLDLFIIFGTFSIIFYYYVLLPIRINRKHAKL